MSLPITDYDVNSTNRAVSVVEAARFCYAGDVKTYRKMTVQIKRKRRKANEETTRKQKLVTFVSVVASIVCAAVYASMYSGSRYMEWPAVVAMLVGAAVSLVLMFTKKAGWANAVIAAADFVAFLYYVYGIYFYVSVVMVGIQATGFNSQFRVCTAMFAVLQVLNLVNVFLKQVKEEA